MRGDCRNTQTGFTLVETLVALFILALVSSAGAALLMGATTASQQVRLQEAEARQLDIAQRLIRQDLAALTPRAVQPADGYSLPGTLFGEAPRGEEAFLRFVRGGWLNPGGIEARSSLQAVEYSLREGKLIREAALRPDATSGTPVSSRILLDGIERIEIEFVRGDQRSEFWRGELNSRETVLPDLVEIEIAFENGGQLLLVALTGGRA